MERAVLERINVGQQLEVSHANSTRYIDIVFHSLDCVVHICVDAETGQGGEPRSEGDVMSQWSSSFKAISCKTHFCANRKMVEDTLLCGHPARMQHNHEKSNQIKDSFHKRYVFYVMN